MPSRFTQYGAGHGAEQALRQMVAERIAAQMEQQKQAVEAYKLQQDDRRINQGDRRIDVDVEQFGKTHGLNVEKFGQDKAEFAAGAPEREARTGYLRTQTRDLEQKPMYADAERAHDEKMAQVQGRIRSGHISQQAAADASSRGNALEDYERKKQIDAKYGGTRPSIGAEKQVLAFYNRAMQASKDIEAIEPEIAKSGLLAQGQLQYAHNTLQTPRQRAYRQGQRAFTEARLRKESGAAIPTAEYENDAKTYFAVPGDDETIIAQKRQARQVVLDGLKFAAGKAYEEYYGEPNQSPIQQQGGGGFSQEFDWVNGQLVPRK